MAVSACTTSVDGKINLIKTLSINNVILVTPPRLKPGCRVDGCEGEGVLYSRKSHSSPLHSPPTTQRPIKDIRINPGLIAQPILAGFVPQNYLLIIRLYVPAACSVWACGEHLYRRGDTWR